MASDSWYTNTAIADFSECSSFSPVVYEVDDPSEPPQEIVIQLEHQENLGGLGVIPEEQITLFSEEADIGDRDGYRSEEVAVGGNFAPIGSYTYDYVVTVEGSLSGEATPPPSSSDPPRGSSRRTPMRICSTRRCSTGSVARLRFTD